MKIFGAFSLFLLLYSGTSIQQIESYQTQNKFSQIKYEELLKEKRTIGLSQLMTTVDYVKLETNSACMINRGAKYLFTDSLIFVSNRDHVLKFSRTGKFLKKIGSPGRGPGEIDRIAEMSLIPERRTVLTYYYKKLSYFSFDGKFVKSVNTGPEFWLKVMEDGRYIVYDQGFRGKEEYTFRLTNEHNDTISVIKNHFKWVNNTGATFGFVSDYFQPFYNYRNKTFFKALYNDTVYFINQNNIEPYYYVNLGKYKLPDELRPEYLVPLGKGELYDDNCDKYYYCNVLEAGDNIFLESLNYKKNIHNFFLYDKEINNGYLLVDKNVKSTGIVNDYDGGLDFWPAGSVNDKQVFMPMNITTLKSKLEQIKSNNKSIKFPEKNQQLIKIISQTDITDNPILMIVTLK